VVTSAPATNAEDLSRMGWEEISPLEADVITSQDKAQVSLPANPESAPNLNGAMESLLSIDDPGVLLETWKPAEDGNGTILRFLDFGGTQRTVSVRSPWMHLDHVSKTDALERGQDAVSMTEDGGFSFMIGAHEIVTLRAIGARK
jgi:alpha-mannosidase